MQFSDSRLLHACTAECVLAILVFRFQKSLFHKTVESGASGGKGGMEKKWDTLVCGPCCREKLVFTSSSTFLTGIRELTSSQGMGTSVKEGIERFPGQPSPSVFLFGEKLEKASKMDISTSQRTSVFSAAAANEYLTQPMLQWLARGSSQAESPGFLVSS